MGVRKTHAAWYGTVFGIVAVLAGPADARAGFVVDPGYELLTTTAGTSFAGVPFVGVPLTAFDFGGGPVPVGDADTIIRRRDPAVAPGGMPGTAPPVPIELVALQLMSAVPADFGLGGGIYYATLQSARGGPASTGTITVTFGPEGDPHGTFDSVIDVFFDLRFGSLNGPIALSGNTPVQAAGVPWGHLPPPAAAEVPGVNTFLNGTDRSADFFPAAFTEQGPPGTAHALRPASVPEPGSLAAVACGVLALAGYRRVRAV